MRKITFAFLILFFTLNISCSSAIDNPTDETTTTIKPDWKCGTHNGKQLWTGPKGGCYYINSNGNKTYVDRSECNNC